MLSDIITYVNSFLEIAETIGIAERYQDGEKIYPAYYCNSGEYKHVDFDQYKSLSYHRNTGAITRIETQSFGCDETVKETYPMRLVIYAPKNCETDDAYANANLAKEIANNIQNIDLNTLRKNNNLFALDIVTGNMQTDSAVVWSQEFTNVPYKLPSTHMLISIDYLIEISGTPACLVDTIYTSQIIAYCGIKDSGAPYADTFIDTG